MQRISRSRSVCFALAVFVVVLSMALPTSAIQNGYSFEVTLTGATEGTVSDPDPAAHFGDSPGGGSVLEIEFEDDEQASCYGDLNVRVGEVVDKTELAGTYDLSPSEATGENVFTLVCSFDGSPSAVRSRSGTVVIEASDESAVSGTFEFIGAPAYAPADEESEIEGEGSFEAAWAG